MAEKKQAASVERAAPAVWRPGDAVRITWDTTLADQHNVDWYFWTVAACDGAWLRLVVRSAVGAEHERAGSYTILVPLTWVACAETGAGADALDDVLDDAPVEGEQYV